MDHRGDRPRGDRRRRPAQAPESKAPSEPKVSKISPAELHAKLDGAPPALAALHAQANDLLPGRPQEPAGARRARCAGTPSSSTSGRPGACPAASSCRSSSACRWTTASAWPSSASTCATTAAPRREAAARHPADLPVLRGPRRQGRQRLPPGGHAEHDLLRRRGQADLHPPGPVPRSRAARRGHPALRGRRDRGPARARPGRGRRRAGAALRGLRATSRASASRRSSTSTTTRRCTSSSSTTARSSAPAACWPTAARSSSGAWPSRPPPRPRLAAELLIEADAARASCTRSGSRSPPSSPPGRSTSAPATPRTATCSSTPGSST